MRLTVLVIALAVVAMGCSKSFPCTRYCWSHKQYVADQAPVGTPDGYFDIQCTRSDGGGWWNPPLPPLGFYSAELCVAADMHEILARTVTSIQDPTIDASQACDVTELQVYADFVQTLALQARDACVAHLTCNGTPAGCDIDPLLGGNQACTVTTAEVLCDQIVLGPALAALGDLSNGPGAAQPQRDGTVIEYVEDPRDCEGLVQEDTDGTPVCGDAEGGGEGVDESSSIGSGGSGADGSSSGSGGAGVEPPGDLRSALEG